ncbi:amidase [Pseudonocardia sp. TRM90224]|uniref:amidase n=1 Tax=Pseudonocardia sp. TRM90224 TaxID=2812678 RepID=UPI001E581A95|nr:amidase [Pseudonocardia sp. TRM90224]
MPRSPASPPDEPLLRASATELVTLLRERKVGAAELLEVVLGRADAITAEVNPFAVRLDDTARAAAAESDRRIAAGTARSLEGLPISAKDSQWLAGVPTTSGSAARAGFVPDRTVGALQRVLDAGAVVFAKTTTTEFCYFATSTAPGFGVTANPHDLTRTAGGSSSGAAAHVAAWAGPLALGGDGGGSIRIPAAFCGLVGHKPTFGLVSHEPSGPGWKSLVAVGPIARTVEDAELLMSVLAAPDPFDRHSVGLLPESGAPLRIAVSPDLGYAPVDDAVRVAFDNAVAALTAAGVDVVAAAPQVTSSIATWATIATAEARWSEAVEFEQYPELLSEQVRDYLAFGEAISAVSYVNAQFARERLHAVYAEFFAATGATALFTPTVGTTAFDGSLHYPARIGGVPVDEIWRDWAPLLCDANLTGLPATTVPIGADRAGLPIGGQLMGPRLSDRRLLRAAAVLTAALGSAARTEPARAI